MERKVLILSISFEGGAGGAAYRLHQGLRRIGVSSQVLVRARSDDDQTVIAMPQTGLAGELNRLRPKLDRLPLKLYPRKEFFSLQWFPDAISPEVEKVNPDVVNLHWVCNSFVRVETLSRLNKPIVWTLHDMWPFTGGCFHSSGCERYIDSCGACPQLHSAKNWDLSRWVWHRKAKAWKDLNLTIVTPSSWLAERAKASSLFKNRRIEVIPHGLDTERYKPIDRRLAREILSLPQDRRIILFGAWTNSRLKGFHSLLSALRRLGVSGWRDKLELVVFGFSKPKDQIDPGIKSHYLGRLYDDLSLALVYSAADVMVVPSIHESFGQTASESLACGTPVVAFNITGLKDVVDHQRNGYLAEPFEEEDLAQGITWVLEDRDRHQRLSHWARKKAEQEFNLMLQARRYLSLFNEVIVL